MNKLRAVSALRSGGLGVLLALGTMAIPAAGLAQNAADAGKVLGISFFGRQVSNLEETIKFYQTLDFKLQGKPTDWQIDEVANRLGGTKGVESRAAVMTVQSSVSDTPFRFIVREYRGIERKNWSSMSSSDLASGHLDLTVLDDCNPWMDKLKAINMLRVPEMNMSGGGDANGPRRFVFVQDPDGWYVELFAIMKPAPGAPPEGPKVSNSTATFENIDRLGKQAGFNHIGLNVLDPQKALAFYDEVMGGDYPPFTPPPAPAAGAAPRMNMMNGWFPQAKAKASGNLRLELIGFPQPPGTQPPAMKYSDIGVTYVGFEVSNLDAVYAQVKAAGAITVSEGGITKVADGRAVVIRDPDVGGFIELWEPAR